MQRNLHHMADTEHDVLVIGGGIYGASIARDAALRGMRVALVERGDFGHATSFNSLKVIHGGFRYLQHLDIRRMRISIRERRIMMTIAPHLIEPLLFCLPTHGHGIRGRMVMRIALGLNDLIGFDRHPPNQPKTRLPGGHLLSKRECLQLFPGLDRSGLTGGAVWPDCQLMNSERLLMGVLHQAAEYGAQIANYVEVTGFLRHDHRIDGVQVFDRLAQEKFDVRARLVVNAAGPWVDHVLHRPNGIPGASTVRWSKAMNVVIQRKPTSRYALGVWSPYDFRDDQAVIQKGGRLFFLVPWRHLTLIGTTHTDFPHAPDSLTVCEEEVQHFLDEVNAGYPALALEADDVLHVNVGLLPRAEGQQTGRDVPLLKEYRLIDHRREHGVDGLLTVVGVKFTEARHVAERVVDEISRRVTGRWDACRTASIPIWGGEIEEWERWRGTPIRIDDITLPHDVQEHLYRSYGAHSDTVLAYCRKPNMAERILENAPVLTGELVYAVRHEMAVTLQDAIARRTDLPLYARPSDTWLNRCADVIGEELGWNPEHRRDQVAQCLSGCSWGWSSVSSSSRG
ncbi:MAG: glycerol-3-phosphate dehydrogenase/oxidase [Nitrospirae bacterium]|nr:MAG: glycerol-3-phosphate dehydrogenase/oxidase [Nitrospirota bacterium]